MPLDQTYLQVSDGSGDAALMHITTPRSIGSTIIKVNTLVGVPAKFIAMYGTPLATGFINPVGSGGFYGHINGTDLQIDGFLPGTTDAGNTTDQIVIIKPNTFWANLVGDRVSKMWPVGSVYINASVNTNPSVLLGFGTWTPFGVGKVPVGVDTSQTEFTTLGQTGGEKTHTLTTGEMPAHQHVMRVYSGGSGALVNPGAAFNTGPTVNTMNSGAMDTAGGGAAHNNLQPYVTVYMWLRTG